MSGNGSTRLQIPPELMEQIRANGEGAYPEEGAGLLLGMDDVESRRVMAVMPLGNAREAEARGNRYLIAPGDIMRAEDEADRLGLEVLGVFHSHPNHTARPSEFDREWALPWYSYLITSVSQGKARESRSWRLLEDRSGFFEEPLDLTTEILE